MHPGKFLLAAASLASTATADAMATMTDAGGSNLAVWYTDFGAYGVNANEGCRNPYIPGIYNFCVDWGNKRLHFNAEGQSKRCIKQIRSQHFSFCDQSGGNRCDWQVWKEVDCTW
ncbi:hypothetical protein V8F06_014750 [Rhypophila decipiens]